VEKPNRRGRDRAMASRVPRWICGNSGAINADIDRDCIRGGGS
jgi:hypothetical protein